MSRLLFPILAALFTIHSLEKVLYLGKPQDRTIHYPLSTNFKCLNYY